MEPAVKTLTFTIPQGDDLPFGSKTIDLSQCASMVNRRFYRQGLNWAVAGFTVRAFEGVTAYLEISKIPDTWVASNSWEKSFHVWDDLNDRALDEAESIRPRFLDFKVYMDHIHHNAGFVANLIPEDSCQTGSNHLFEPGEWESSKLSIPQTNPNLISVDREFIWVGPSYPGVSAVTGLDAVGLIEGYAASRGLPDVLDPNRPDDAADVDGTEPENWMSAVDNQALDQVQDTIETLIDENNIAPYPFENDGLNADTMYPGGANNAPCLELHCPIQVTAASTTSMARAPGTNFQGGLIRVQHSITSSDPSIDAEVILQVHLVPGQHRGYLCEPQQDV